MVNIYETKFIFATFSGELKFNSVVVIMVSDTQQERADSQCIADQAIAEHIGLTEVF